MASEVWRYFVIKKDNNLFATCLICDSDISRGKTKSTSNLKKHLSGIHHIKVKPLKKNEPTPTQNSKSSTSLQKFFPSAKRTSFDLEDVDEPELIEDDEISAAVNDSINCPSTSQIRSRPTCTSVCSVTSPQEFRPPSAGQVVPVHQLQKPTTHSSTPSPVNFSSSPVNNEKISKTVALLHPKPIKINQPTLVESFDRSRKFQPGDLRAKIITRLIAEMICIDFQPFTIVENRGFRNLIAHLEPRYVIPTRKTFCNKIVEMYNSIYTNIKEELKDITYVGVTTDMWTSISAQDYMSVTCHFYKDEQLHHKCLEVAPFAEISHTAINLKEFLSTVLSDWGLTTKVVAVVRDNGPDIKAALSISDFDDVSCTAHNLQLVIKDGFLNHPKINNLITKCKKLVGSFKKSARNTKILRRCQKQLHIPEHRLIQDEPTRWNSSYYMMRRLHEQKNAIIMTAAYSDVTLNAEMTADDWRTMEAAIDILAIFEMATRQLSKSSSTISEIIPMVKLLLHNLQTPAPSGSGLQGMKNDLRSSLKIRFSSIETDKLLGPATILDPRFKDKAFSSEENAEEAKTALLQEMENGTIDELVGTPPKSGTSSTESTSLSTEGIWAKYKSIFAATATYEKTIPANNPHDELTQYLAEPSLTPESSSEEVLNYWSRSNYSRLKKLLPKYICVPPSTVTSERLFSTAGTIVDKKRNRMDPERVKHLVFLNKNL